ncbi:MAG: LPS assembly lipoprotein LptE [Bacteroidota bacterium]|jgi:hypothetical protein
MNTASAKTKYLPAYFLVLLLSMMHGSCRMKYGLSDASVSPNLKSISIATFQNFAPLSPPYLSQNFTEGLRSLVSSQSRLKLLVRGGDLIMNGKITGYAIAPAAVSSVAGQSAAAINRLTITVQVSFVNTQNPKQDFEQSFSQFADFPATSTLSSEEGRLTREIQDKLTQDIFNRCFSNW